MFAISGKSFNSFLLGDVLFILNITTSVEPSLIFLVTKNLFFFQLLRVLWDLHRAFDPFHLLVYMHVSFIHSTIKWCQALGQTGCSHTIYIPAEAQSWVKFISFTGLGVSWRQELGLSAPSLGPGTKRYSGKLVKPKFSTNDSRKLGHGSAGKESACNVGDLGLIPGLERSLEKEKATHSSILAWRIPWAYSPWGHKESDTTE